MQGSCCDGKDRHLPTVVMDNFIRRMIAPPEKKISRFVHAGNAAADLGCGPGYFTVSMAELTRPNGKVYAVDSDERSIQALRTKTKAGALERIIDARVGSAADVRHIPTKFVDFVLAYGLLCCMTDHKGAVAEIKRILRATGIAYLSVARICRRDDPRAVRKEEWHQILTGFNLLENGEGILNRWATVSPLA